jgi:hypothetical protein
MRLPRHEPRGVPPRWVVRAVLGVRRLLQRGVDRSVPPEVVLFEQAAGLTKTFVLRALVELDVAPHLVKQPLRADELAPMVGADIDALHRLLRAAAVFEIVELERDGRFRSTPLLARLDPRHEQTMAHWVRYFASPANIEAWAELPAAIRTGDSAFRRVHGTDVWSWFAEHADERQDFAAALGVLTAAVSPAIVAGYPFPERGVVCDVGGGVGALLARVLAERPQLRGVLVDRPEVLADAEQWLTAAGMRQRIELVAADAFDRVPCGHDVYVLKNMLHAWDDHTCRRLLDSVRGAMGACARLVVIEALQQRYRVDPFASLSDLQMLVAADRGRERSLDELDALFTSSGLAIGRVVETSIGLAVIEVKTAQGARSPVSLR